MIPTICCASMLMCGMTVYGQKSSSINPIKTSVLPNVGWRDIQSDKETSFDMNNPSWPKVTANLNQKDLISVLPKSYCVISGFGRKPNRGMMTFLLEVKLQKGNDIAFDAEQNIVLEIEGKTYKALPSKALTLTKGRVLKGEINIPLRKSLKKNRTATLYVTIGNDKHRFELGGRAYGDTQELALVPYNPLWMDVKRKEEPQKEIETVEKAVKKAEDVTNEIKGDLKELLATMISELRAQKKLTENTQVDVNAEVMPEVKKDGQVEYNMKVRYDVQVLSEHLKKLRIDEGTEDWPSGKYRLKDSQAALQTAGIIKSTIESKLEQYIAPGTEVTVKIIGSTDASPFRNAVAYDGTFGEIKDAEYFVNGSFGYVSVNTKDGISSNEQLAYLRTLDIKNFMQKHIGAFRVANVHYEHFAEVADKVGAEYRRVAVEVTIHNAFQKDYPEIASYKENVYERTSEVDTNIPETTAKSNAVAVVIGNTDYQVATGKQGSTKVGPVKYAVNDATTMRDYLVKTLGLDEKNILFKTNADKKDFDDIFGTDNQEGELAKLVASTGSKEVYFYYSGHGYPFMGEPYLLGVRSNPKSCKEQATSLQSIYRILSALPVDKVNVITDACFSGQEISMEASATEFVRRPKPDKLAKFVILSASGEDQYANWYKEKKHGLFSYVLFKAMQDKAKSDLNGDGVLSFDELYKYLSDNQSSGVPYLVKELEGNQVRQDPVIQVSARKNDVFVKY
ncbi:MAG TPA: caspase family protein [Bacteroides mediterraneensis]|uniref:caspase family protein n=1 Tax=Bacteroides mediterraneensis TaxID=1841856 RepID=UPI0026EBF46F|nr:caspase family protein [Bacteroides mediterraneensis]HJH66514.1 caspase family protein [Bacteroides mediterraneensis]